MKQTTRYRSVLYLPCPGADTEQVIDFAWRQKIITTKGYAEAAATSLDAGGNRWALVPLAAVVHSLDENVASSLLAT